MIETGATFVASVACRHGNFESPKDYIASNQKDARFAI